MDERLSHVPQFLRWLEEKGANFPRVTLGKSPSSDGLSVITKEEISPGSTVISVPLSVVINDASVRRAWPELSNFDGPSIGADRWSLVYLFLVAERSRGASSSVAPLVSVLPSSVRTPVSYSDAELSGIRGTNLHEAVLGIRSRLFKLSEAFPSLASVAPAALGGVTCGMAVLVWAYEVFWSRCFAVLLGGEEVASLVPLCGMLNHSQESHVTYVTDEAAGTFSIRSEMAVPAGAEFLNNYRHRSNEKLLLNYGFVCQNNPLDSFTIKVNVMEEEPLVAEKKAILASRGIGWEHYLTIGDAAGDPIPSSLFDCLRVLCMDESEVYFFCPEQVPVGSRINQRNELEMLWTLAGLLSKQLEKLVFKDVEADLALLKTEACTTNAVMHSIVTYRSGQAAILRHCANLAGVLCEQALVEAAVTWSPTFVHGVRPSGGIEEFNAFAAKAGIFRGVTYAVDSADGSVRLVATSPIKKGDPIISIPRQFVVTCEMIAPLISQGGLAAVVSHFRENFEVIASLLLIACSKEGAAAPLAAILGAFPREIVSPLFLEPSEMEKRLAGTSMLADCLELREQLFQEHQAIVRLLSKKKARTVLPLRAFLWARLLVDARTAESADGDPAFFLLPFLPRHSPYHRLEKTTDPATGSLEFHACCAIEPGQEVFDFVGSDQSQDHFLRFGFLLAENDHDIHDIALDMPESDQLAQLQSRLIEQLDLSVPQHFLREGEFPRKLLDSVRVYAMNEEELHRHIESGLTTIGEGSLSEETERTAHGTLLEILSAVASELPETEDDEGDDDTPVNRSVAVYCERQRQIVESTIEKLWELGGDLLIGPMMEGAEDGEEETQVPDGDKEQK